ncbi:unnamed protein product, partial [Allacma fusca]
STCPLRHSSIPWTYYIAGNSL